MRPSTLRRWLLGLRGMRDSEELSHAAPPTKPLLLRSGPAGNKGFEDLTDGWELIVTMQPRTPLAWLKRHKEYHPGAHHPQEVVPDEHAIWVPKAKSWAALGIDLPEMPPSTMASPIGQIPENGGDFLPFLIRYRTIIETLAPDRQDAEIAALKAEWPDYARVLEPKKKPRSSPKTKPAE